MSFYLIDTYNLQRTLANNVRRKVAQGFNEINFISVNFYHDGRNQFEYFPKDVGVRLKVKENLNGKDGWNSCW